MALVVERHRAHPAPRRTLTQEDERMLADVAATSPPTARTGCLWSAWPASAAWRLQAEGCLSRPIRLHHHSVYSGAADGACGAAAGKYRPARGQIAQLWAIRIPAVSRSSSAAAPGRARQRSGRSPTHGKQSERTRRTEKARRQEERQPPALGLLLSLKEPVNDLQSHCARYLW